MSFTKIFLSAAFLTCLAAAARAQATCALTVDKAPEIRGLRLGMPLSEVKSIAPDIQVYDRGFGYSSGALNQASTIDAVRFKGVNSISLNFVDERLTGLSVSYDNSVYWENTGQFVAKVSEAFKLPAAWEGDDVRIMSCNGFKITVQPNSIAIADTKSPEVVLRRQAEEAERKRQNFRP